MEDLSREYRLESRKFCFFLEFLEKKFYDIECIIRETFNTMLRYSTIETRDIGSICRA